MSGPSDRSIAAALQRVLLPPGLPDVADWALATLYEPAGEAVLVGGDFYDWFTLPNGNVLFFIGDVSGKGPVAGALGMSIRKALKGITWLTEDPTTALPALQQALADEFREAFATLCLVELTPASGRVRLIMAGHPAPWIRRGGRFEEVSAPENGMLGLDLQTEWKAAELLLEPGDLLVLFSDGLTEARVPGGQLFGEGEFQLLLSELDPALSSYETALQIDDHLRRVTAPLTDDVIISVLCYRPNAPTPSPALPVGRLLALRLSPHPTAVPLARRFVGDACKSWATAVQVRSRVELVTSELVTAAVRHTDADLELRVAHTPDTVRVEVRQRSEAGTVPVEEPDDRSAAGGAGRDRLERLLDDEHGLALVEELTAGAGVIEEDGTTVLWATVTWPGTARTPAG